MSAIDVASIIGGGVASAAAVASWIVAIRANQRAKKANQHAELANQLAADALREAREANDIAQHANQLSEEANTISRAETAHQIDPSHVEWVAKWDPDRGVVTITNCGRDVAFKASVIARGHDIDELVRAEHEVERGGEVLIPFPEIAEQRADHIRRESVHYATSPKGSFAIKYPDFSFVLDLDVRWVSEFGKPGQQLLELRIS